VRSEYEMFPHSYFGLAIFATTNMPQYSSLNLNAGEIKGLSTNITEIKTN